MSRLKVGRRCLDVKAIAAGRHPGRRVGRSRTERSPSEASPAVTLESVKTLMVTGGAGFIGSALVRRLIRETDYRVVNVDKLTYAGNLGALDEVAGDPRYEFERVDVCDARAVR